MRKVFSVLLLFVCPVLLQAQINISAKAVKQNEGQYLLTIHVDLEKGVRLYGENAAENISGPRVRFVNAKIAETVLQGSPVKIKDALFENRILSVYSGSFDISAAVKVEGVVPETLNGELSCYTASGDAFTPVELKFSVVMVGGVNNNGASLKIPSINIKHPLNGNAEPSTNEYSAISVFILGFLGGLLALLTPCVFPMIPVTVSFFTTKASNKKEGIRNGMLYGIFILLIYLSASLPFHLIKNTKPELLNNIATSAPLNLIFFVIFLIFAISFFGVFDLSLPSSVATRAGKKSGIFFMALTLCIVSFSCTGPILGSLLAGSLQGGAWLLTAGLGGFGVALGLPFGLFAVFPQALKKLPRSGAWMDTVKKILAFVELALAFKFLSNADLVMHWGILKREIFIGIWVLISLIMMCYLLINGRMILGAISFVLVIYLGSGLFGNSLSLLSGFPPPTSYSLVKGDKKLLEADVVNDYEAALQLAKTQNKKLLIDFTGWACVNCRKMEEHVWTDPAVAAYIKENFVLVSLYVDDKKMLPEHLRSDSVQTVGDKFAKFQSLNFAQASQPLYAVLNGDQQLLTTPKAYEPDADKFLNWLQKSNVK